MAIEQAGRRAVEKPWGRIDLRPWSDVRHEAEIGEIWFERADGSGAAPALLLKLLFTTEALSIQVHPDDAFARAIGLANGKSEAWVVLAAAADAQVALGLTHEMTAPQLRAAIDDGSIAGLVRWRRVRESDVIDVPAGVIHAIGAGLVIAEIQQRSDATFRLHDFERKRELHAERAVAAAQTGAPRRQIASRRLSPSRTVLVAGPHFIIERINLPSDTAWELMADRETWLLALSGDGRIGLMTASVGRAIFIDADRARLTAGAGGMKGLIAYVGPDVQMGLLRPLRHVRAQAAAEAPILRPRASGIQREFAAEARP